MFISLKKTALLGVAYDKRREREKNEQMMEDRSRISEDCCSVLAAFGFSKTNPPLRSM